MKYRNLFRSLGCECNPTSLNKHAPDRPFSLNNYNLEMTGIAKWNLHSALLCIYIVVYCRRHSSKYGMFKLGPSKSSVPAYVRVHVYDKQVLANKFTIASNLASSGLSSQIKFSFLVYAVLYHYKLQSYGNPTFRAIVVFEIKQLALCCLLGCTRSLYSSSLY